MTDELETTTKVLFETEWLALREVKCENPPFAYIYAHSKASQGKAVALLPFRYDNGEPEFMLRREVCPAWGLEPKVCSVTGGWEGGPMLETAKMELEEECGYRAPFTAFIPLGTCHHSKASDTVLHLYAVDLSYVATNSEIEAVEATGDGSTLEELAESFWGTLDDLEESDDALLYVMYQRLQKVSGI